MRDDTSELSAFPRASALLDGVLRDALPVACGEAGVPLLDRGDLVADALDVVCCGGAASERARGPLLVLGGHCVGSGWW